MINRNFRLLRRKKMTQSKWQETWIKPLIIAADHGQERRFVKTVKRANTLKYKRFPDEPVALQNRFRSLIADARHDAAAPYLELFDVRTGQHLNAFQEGIRKLCRREIPGLDDWIIEGLCLQMVKWSKSPRLDRNLQNFQELIRCRQCRRTHIYSTKSIELSSQPYIRVDRWCIGCHKSQATFFKGGEFKTLFDSMKSMS